MPQVPRYMNVVEEAVSSPCRRLKMANSGGSRKGHAACNIHIEYVLNKSKAMIFGELNHG